MKKDQAAETEIEVVSSSDAALAFDRERFGIVAYATARWSDMSLY